MKKKKFVALIATLMVASNVGIALASNPNTPDRPFDFTLKSNQGNTYATTRTKDTTNQYSYVKCTGLKNTEKVTFWIDNTVGPISPDVHRGISNYFSVLRYFSNEYTTKGDKVRLGVENYYNTTKTGSVSGLVDYE
ncbi:MAG: hypothetical protein ACRC30_04660 [Clostridium sp.]